MSHFRLSIAFVLAIGSIARSAPPQTPNILIIVSDDQGWTDFGFMGHPAIRTPNLDRLASQGVLFTNGYVTAPVCRPSLASIISGQYGFQTRICGNNPPAGTPRTATHGLIKAVPTIPRLLAGAGYRSLQTGKFWEGDYANAGFTDGMTGEGDRHGSRTSLAIGRDGLKPIDDFLDSARDKPWLIWYAPMMPHDPHTPPERILNKYLAPDRPVRLAKYWAMCEWFDETCGQLLDNLARRKVLDNTMVVFIVDNGWIQETGPTKHNVGWFADRSKLSPYDGGLRTPIILSWPGRIKPQRRTELVSSIDLAPTILQACGLEKRGEMPGVNLMDVLSGAVGITNRPVFSEVYVHTEVELNNPASSLTHRVVREREWKLIAPVNSQRKPELYNIASDPTELKNVASDQPDRVARLTALLDAWWKPGSTTKPAK